MLDARGIQIEENDHVVVCNLPGLGRQMYFGTVNSVLKNSVSIKRMGSKSGKSIVIDSHHSGCIAVVDGLPND